MMRSRPQVSGKILTFTYIEELRIAIEIIEHTLETLYEILEKASDLKVRRFKRKNT